MNRRPLLAVASLALVLTSAAAIAQGAPPLLPPPPVVPSAPVQANPQQPQMGTPYDTSDAAFGQALRNIAPLSPDQIERARRRVDEVDRASGKPLAPVTPVTRSIAVSLKSGEMPPSVKVAPGWISTITFSDISGAPWPVLAVTNGNPSAYDVKSSGPEGNTNIITISAKQGYIPSNIAITLVGAKVPILMTLDPMGSQVDYRVDAQIDSRGPNAMLDVVSGTALQPTGDSVMLAFLDGVPPNGAKAKKTGSRDVQAWGFNDQLYVRTSQTLLSPAYISKQTNVSGVNVYVLGEAPVLVVSSGGRMGTVQVGR
jgi:intracellular multiplication protein IcmK